MPKKTIKFLKGIIKREIKYLTNTPTRLLLFMTYRCTSQCKMCTIWKHGKKIEKEKELSLEDWKNFFDNLDLKHIRSVEIFGGDSLLRKDVTLPLIEYIKEKNNKIESLILIRAFNLQPTYQYVIHLTGKTKFKSRLVL